MLDPVRFCGQTRHRSSLPNLKDHILYGFIKAWMEFVATSATLGSFAEL